MPVPPPLECRDEGENYQRQSYEGEKNMGSENWKINRRQPAGITGRFFADVDMVDNVTNQETSGADDCRNHARDVSLPNLPANPKPSGCYEDCAQKIERSVNGREV